MKRTLIAVALVAAALGGCSSGEDIDNSGNGDRNYTVTQYIEVKTSTGERIRCVQSVVSLEGVALSCDWGN